MSFPVESRNDDEMIGEIEGILKKTVRLEGALQEILDYVEAEYSGGLVYTSDNIMTIQRIAHEALNG